MSISNLDSSISISVSSLPVPRHLYVWLFFFFLAHFKLSNKRKFTSCIQHPFSGFFFLKK